MKWTVAGAGVLLCVAGAYALLTGSSIILVERGWATFIAGAVFLGAGVVVLGMAVLIGRIEQLIAATDASGLRRREVPLDGGPGLAQRAEQLRPYVRVRGDDGGLAQRGDQLFDAVRTR